jgi:hypothetical protein
MRPGTIYTLTDFRLFSPHAEITLQDIGDVERTRTRLDRLIGTSTIVARPRDPRRQSVALRHIRHGAQLAALIELLAGDPQPSLDAAAVQAALAWEPPADRRWREALAAAAGVAIALLAVTAGLQSSSPAVVYAPDDPIYPGGQKQDHDDIVRFMESTVMPWAREALAPIKGGADNVTCGTCHGADPPARLWEMPAVSALPEPHFKQLGWETYSAGMDAQMRNAIYGYLAESENQARAAYMREVVLPGMARILKRPAYDFTRSYEYNRRRAGFGCYHCHRVN